MKAASGSTHLAAHFVLGADEWTVRWCADRDGDRCEDRLSKSIINNFQESRKMSSEKARIFGRQLAAARELLNITQAQLAEAAGVHQPIIARIEAGTVDPRATTIAKLQEAIERQGVEFTNGRNPGVRFKDDRAFPRTP